MNFCEYPKMLYHLTDAPIVVDDEQEEAMRRGQGFLSHEEWMAATHPESAPILVSPQSAQSADKPGKKKGD